MFGLLWGVVVVLAILWVLGFLVFHVAGSVIHILLLIAVIVLVYNLIMRSRRHA
ncbi:MAG TPA: lmo0937 family membrane protein [Dictyobacter sp.]|jgi:hypothetical protein|nr:lmo0937 family membrane protein [Dictyobacter sp.]